MRAPFELGKVRRTVIIMNTEGKALEAAMKSPFHLVYWKAIQKFTGYFLLNSHLTNPFDHATLEEFGFDLALKLGVLVIFITTEVHMKEAIIHADYKRKDDWMLAIEVGFIPCNQPSTFSAAETVWY